MQNIDCDTILLREAVREKGKEDLKSQKEKGERCLRNTKYTGDEENSEPIDSRQKMRHFARGNTIGDSSL